MLLEGRTEGVVRGERVPSGHGDCCNTGAHPGTGAQTGSPQLRRLHVDQHLGRTIHENIEVHDYTIVNNLHRRR